MSTIAQHIVKDFIIRFTTPAQITSKQLSRYLSTAIDSKIDFSNNVTNRTPLDVLQGKVDSTELAHDEYQFKVAQALQSLHHEIETYHEPKANVFSRLFQKKTLQSPKGLYIHGAVGGGKTLLMDIFFECCKVSLFITVKHIHIFLLDNP